MRLYSVVFTLGLGLLWSTLSFAQSLQGVFMVVKGDIKVLSADGKSDAAKVGKKVNSGDTIVSGTDARAKIVMADKNVINISPDSKITIERYENDGKDKKNVELKIEYGKIRASVEEKYDGEKSKFNIKTPSAVAGVRGTDFLTGYTPSTKATSVVTFSGTVAVGKPGPGGSIQNPVFVQQGQMTSTSSTGTADKPKAVPKEDLNKMNSDTKAETAKNDSAKDSQQPGEKKSDEKKEDEKKDETKKEDSRKDEPKEAKKDEPKKEDAKKDEGKKEANRDSGSDKKPEPSSPSDKKETAGNKDAGSKSDSSGNKNAGGDNNSPPNSTGSGTARAPASTMPSAGMINMTDLPTAPGGGALPQLPTAGPAVPMIIPTTLVPTLPTYLAPPPVTGKVKANIILVPQ